MGRRKKTEVEQVVSQVEEKVATPRTKTVPRFELISSGSDVFDLVLGGGFPFGKIVNIIGDKSTGKTLLASEVIAQARKKYENTISWNYDDAESGYSFNTQLLYGFEIFHETQESSFTLEEFEMAVDSHLEKMKKEQYFIYILDSLDALTTEEEVERYAKRKKAHAEGKEIAGSYSLEKQKKLSEFFRLLRKKIDEKKCLLIIISQVRANIGVMFGAKYVRTGGKALDFYASQIIWLAETEKHERKGRAVGVTIKAKVTKNKIALPFRECFINLLFDYGVDNVSTNIDFLYDLKTDGGKSKGNERLNWDGALYTPKALIIHLEKNNLEGELTRRVQEKWQGIEEEISQGGWRKKK